MQLAITILNIEDGLSKKQKEEFRCDDVLLQSCDCDVTEDGNDDLKKVTFQKEVFQIEIGPFSS